MPFQADWKKVRAQNESALFKKGAADGLLQILAKGGKKIEEQLKKVDAAKTQKDLWKQISTFKTLAQTFGKEMSKANADQRLVPRGDQDVKDLLGKYFDDVNQFVEKVHDEAEKLEKKLVAA